jgi:hypothetical protein
LHSPFPQHEITVGLVKAILTDSKEPIKLFLHLHLSLSVVKDFLTTALLFPVCFFGQLPVHLHQLGDVHVSGATKAKTSSFRLFHSPCLSNNPQISLPPPCALRFSWFHPPPYFSDSFLIIVHLIPRGKMLSALPIKKGRMQKGICRKKQMLFLIDPQVIRTGNAALSKLTTSV